MNKTVILLFAFLMLQGVSGLLDIAKKLCQNDFSYIATIVTQEVWAQIEAMAFDSCGGSIIDVKWVLTSSTCIEKMRQTHGGSDTKLTIIAGFDAALKNLQTQLMKACFPFKTFTSRSGGARHDIALVELEQPFQQGPTLRPIKIATKDLSSKCKKATIVTPFAASPPKGGSRTFRAALDLICGAVNILQPDSCTSIWSWMKVAKDSFCGEKQSNWRKKREIGLPSVCSVPEGSPLVCDNVLIGVETGCQKNGARSSSSVFVKVNHYLDFIAATLKNDSINPKEDNIKTDQKKTTTAKPSTSGGGFLEEAVQKTNLLLIMGAVLFVYF